MSSKSFKFPVIFLIIMLLSLPVSMKVQEAAFSFAGKAYALSAGNGPFSSNIFVDVAKKQNPAVVNVSSKEKKKAVMPRNNPRDPRGPRRGPAPTPPGQNPFDEFFDQFGPQERRPQQGMGSGFLMDKDGHILTNHHVIEGAEQIVVTYQDDKEYNATLIGSDPKTDVALIKIEPKKEDAAGFPFLKLGDSDELEVGEWVIAIGSPFGLGHTVTVGVVSAKGRNIGAGPYDEFIQTDASINPGNSGGPLLNIKGDVIGINTAIISGGSGGNVGIGFALPINIAKSILSDLKDKGAVTRGWLGVMIQKITPELAKTFGLQGNQGALVGDVLSDSPAQKAGIQRGDVIVKFNNQEVKSVEVLPKYVAGTTPGKTVSMEIIRDGKNKQVDITIAILKDKAVEEKQASLGDPLGAQVQDITADLAQSMNLTDTEGALVADITPGTPAGDAGLRRGDVIAEVNRHVVRNAAEYRAATAKIKSGDTALLLVKRGGNTIYIAVKVG